MLTLKSLIAFKRSAGFSGTVTFEGDLGEIQLKLSADQLRKIMLVCGEALIEVSKIAATGLFDEVCRSVEAGKKS